MIELPLTHHTYEPILADAINCPVLLERAWLFPLYLGISDVFECEYLAFIVTIIRDLVCIAGLFFPEFSVFPSVIKVTLVRLFTIFHYTVRKTHCITSFIRKY